MTQLRSVTCVTCGRLIDADKQNIIWKYSFNRQTKANKQHFTTKKLNFHVLPLNTGPGLTIHPAPIRKCPV